MALRSPCPTPTAFDGLSLVGILVAIAIVLCICGCVSECLETVARWIVRFLACSRGSSGFPCRRRDVLAHLHRWTERPPGRIVLPRAILSRSAVHGRRY